MINMFVTLKVTLHDQKFRSIHESVVDLRFYSTDGVVS
jgi:hypothetical protein